jgi:putative transposase
LPTVRQSDRPLRFWTSDYVREWLPGWRASAEITDERIVTIIRGGRDPVAEAAKRHGIAEQTIHTSRKRLGELCSEDVRRLRRLEEQNARLKKLIAERNLEIEVMKEVVAKKLASVPRWSIGR